jgi:hypothetical protein
MACWTGWIGRARQGNSEPYAPRQGAQPTAAERREGSKEREEPGRVSAKLDKQNGRAGGIRRRRCSQPEVGLWELA